MEKKGKTLSVLDPKWQRWDIISGLLVAAIIFFGDHYSTAVFHIFLMKCGKQGQGMITNTYTLGGGRFIQNFAVLTYECPPHQMQTVHIPIGLAGIATRSPAQIHYLQYGHSCRVTLDDDYGQSTPKIVILVILLVSLLIGVTMIFLESRNKEYLQL